MANTIFDLWYQGTLVTQAMGQMAMAIVEQSGGAYHASRSAAQTAFNDYLAMADKMIGESINA